MKVKLLKLALATALSLLFFSCKNDNNNIVNEPQSDTSIIDKYSYKITTDEAKEQAIKLYTTVFASSLRSTSIPKIKSIDKIGANSTRSTSNIDDDNEVGVYVINFDDNKGFMILSDDKRTEPIIALSSEGNFDTSKPIDNPNLYPILANAETMLRNSRDNNKPRTDRLVDGHTGKMEEEIVRYQDWKLDYNYEPLVQVEWGQEYPYNLKIDTIVTSKGKRKPAPVGCVATAVAQIMSYHRKPSLNWDLIIKNLYNVWAYKYDTSNFLNNEEKEYIENNISTLFKDLGKPENLEMKYGEQSSTQSEKVPRTFRNYGYNCGDLIDYNFSLVKNEIANKRPVYISAVDIKKTEKKYFLFEWLGTKKISHKGHAWVLDGVKRLKRKGYRVTEWGGVTVYEWEEYQEFVHCNLGWNGSGNGYYHSGIFDTNNSPKEVNTTRCTTKEDKEGTEGYYKFEQKIITDIRP